MTQTVLFEDLIDEKIDNRGKTPPLVKAGYPLLEVNAISKNRLHPDLSKVSKYVDEEIYSTWFRQHLQKNDILFTTVGTIAESAIIPDNSKIKMTVAQNILGFRFKQQIVSPLFALYFMRSQQFLYQIGGRTVETVQKSIKWADMRGIKVELPDLETQKKIANILGTIDEKIELNRQMNETLEQMGQALFRHYFIDNPEADEWESGIVADLVNVYSGYAFKRTDFDPDGEFGLVTIKNVQDGSFLPECSDYLSIVPERTPDYAYLQTGDVLLSLTGNVGRVCIAYGENLLLNQRVAKLAGPSGRNSFAYFMFRQEGFKQKLISMSRGTAQLNLSPIETKNIKIKLPPADVLEDFYGAAEPLFGAITENYQQIQTLTTLRDTLLPRLISGKAKA